MFFFDHTHTHSVKRDELFPAYGHLMVKGDHTSNSIESYMNRCGQENPNDVEAVRDANDLFDWAKSVMKQLEAMNCIRRQFFCQQTDCAAPLLLTTKAYDMLKLVADEALHQPVRFKN